ncbi:unnamed protein product [Brassicogethes aeneus]|uniref:Uncharacterized protein n=1 Tax=Brassicogethes aeneus TaxID=1431903 RepID=A0A9P0BF10_BRAAE|nr:unnamed protein product [Brassicogethes aeneus]
MSQPNERIIPIKIEGRENTTDLDNLEEASSLSPNIEIASISHNENNNSQVEKSKFTDIFNKKNINDIKEFKPKMSYSQITKKCDNETLKRNSNENNLRLLREDAITKYNIKTLSQVLIKEDEHFKKYMHFKGQFKNEIEILSSFDKPYVWEKVVFIIDCGEDENVTPFNINNRNLSALEAIKLRICMYVNQKKNLSQERLHEFGIIVMTTHSAFWYLNFTKNTDLVKNKIWDLESFPVEDIFNFDSVFELLQEIPQPNHHESPNNDTPIYILHPIIFYNRSYTIPMFDNCHKGYLENSHIALDIIMSHENKGTDNRVDDICQVFKLMQKINKQNIFVPIGRSYKKFVSASYSILGHPMKRGLQVIKD